ncbi:MAG: Asp-tRNA(Asn)/Glu-tRNA(Gln) amidotransferase subunit GatB [Armatimonadetes bacterium]|jgi:aspartyl-tRNA(Asn)/glutamyl-tRNA(Gln) amidotransferase subunit B|nr:Asp-tRNA(Asn)/Glu-tRNA(Gln) amidotransferase subunit GatB [Armatimonadota bacterium]
MTTQPLIGLEVHAQLLTTSKMFCGCPTEFGAPPNTQVCPICTAQPGALPVPNQRAVEMTILTGLALHCDIAPRSVFARKNYFYPDLTKNYQISQYEQPLCENGYVLIDTESGPKRIRVRRVHLEEDTGKNIHGGAGAASRIDFNRCGLPLMEIVSEPDLTSADECRAYLQKLQLILRWIGVCNGNMEEGSMRCEPTVNVIEVGGSAKTALVEIKNLASFRAVHQAVDYEILRHTRALLAGEPTTRETRRWLAEGRTETMRSKEEAHDYRYFPEPDLMPLEVDEAMVTRIGADMPEGPDEVRERLIEQYELSSYDATVMTQSREFAAFFEAAAGAAEDPKAVANWMQGDFARLLNETGTPLAESKVSPAGLADLVRLIADGAISGKMAKTVFERMFETGKAPALIVDEEGMSQISDTSALEPVIDKAIADNPEAVENYRSGKKKALGALVGQIMKETKGQANPALVNELLVQRLGE